MNTADIIGFSASISLTITLLPQIYKTFIDKKLDDLSYGFIFLNFITCFLFLAYSILIKALPILLANSLVLTQWIILTSAKIYFQLYPFHT